jgi:NADH dehydrogenase
MAIHKVVIVGGGFGGIKAALELSNVAGTHVTLISDQRDFRYYPTLYRAATGGSRAQSVIPLEEIFQDKTVSLLYDRAEKLDRKSQSITTAGKKKVTYDTLILALGVMTNYFGIKGLEQYSYGIKSIEEATGLKHHLHQQLIGSHRPDFNYVVIGGGPTGVELAGALPAYIKHIMKKHGIKYRAVHVDLIEGAPRLMPRMPKDVSRSVQKRLRKLGVKLYLGKTVEGETIDTLMVGGKPIPSSTVVWTAGVTNNPFFKENDFTLTDKGKVKVDEFLGAEQDIFVIGDNADTPYSGMAQTALQDAKSVADNIKRRLSGSAMEAYKPKKPIYVTPAGPQWAAVLWGNIRIYGRVGWALRRAADFIAYHDLEPWWKAGRKWLEEDKKEEDCAYCAVAQET